MKVCKVAKIPEYFANEHTEWMGSENPIILWTSHDNDPQTYHKRNIFHEYFSH